MKHSRRKGFQIIKDRLTYGGKAPLHTSMRERRHGRDITWTLQGMPAPEWVVENWPGSATVIAVRSKGRRKGKSIDETRYYVTSLRTSAEALLRHVRDRWSIENSWHWPRDTQLGEDGHRYREPNGVQILATLRSLAMNALRLMASGPSLRAWLPSRTTSGAYWSFWAGENHPSHWLLVNF